MLQFRSACIAAVRSFFSSQDYLEVDTPALAPALIPETCLEVFRADYLVPFREGPDSAVPLFLAPSPEIYIKRLIADHGVSMFQVSKCYRNVESVGKIHSPEFTMLEYYTMKADYLASLDLTESLFTRLIDTVFPTGQAPEALRPPFLRLTMDEAFSKYAGFSLADCAESADLARQAAKLGLGQEEILSQRPWDDLYELLLVHAVEPALPRNRPVAILDYPARVPCLARERSESRSRSDGSSIEWRTKERWELYVNRVELANCYTEERDPVAINAYFAAEGELKGQTARVPHPAVNDFGSVCAGMPPCSGVALGLDRLIMVLAGRSTLDSVIPFPLTDHV